MKKSTKIWLGALTLAPLLFMAVFFYGYFSFIMEIVQNGNEMNHNPEMAPVFLREIFIYIVFIILAALIGLGIKIYYIIHSNSNPKFDSNQRLVWILLLIFVGTLGSIVYYFVEILPLKEKTALE